MKLNLFKVFTVIKRIAYLVNIGYVNHSNLMIFYVFLFSKY